MTMTTEVDANSGGARPRIIVTVEDHARLSTLARAAMARMPDLAADLADELDRADVLPNDHRSHGVVMMGSEVEFRDDANGKVRKVTLVYPAAADITAHKVSVLTPVGAALLGARAGDSIGWETPAGDRRSLTIVNVG